ARGKADAAPQASADGDIQAKLKDPNVVHVHMLRGTIAPITFDQLAHILGDETTAEWIANRRQCGGDDGLLPVDECAAIRSRADGYKDGTDEQFHYMNGYLRACSNDPRAVLAAQPVISGYTCTVPDDCETLH